MYARKLAEGPEDYWLVRAPFGSLSPSPDAGHQRISVENVYSYTVLYPKIAHALSSIIAHCGSVVPSSFPTC